MNIRDLISFSAFKPVSLRDVTDNIRFALLQVLRRIWCIMLSDLHFAGGARFILSTLQ